MHRQFSLQPFSRHYSHSTNPFLDFLEISDEASSSGEAMDRNFQAVPSTHSPNVVVRPEGQDFLVQVLRARQEALHTLTFVTINDYLFLLRAVSEEMACLKRNSMYYLAAAVSDFYLPRQKMVCGRYWCSTCMVLTHISLIVSQSIKYSRGRVAF
jgi:phosphopantothenate---cysteine ligase (ATP)